MNLTKEIIQGLELQLIEAIKTGNTDFIGKVLHNDLLFIAPNGQIITKEVDLASHKAGEMKVVELIPVFEEFSIIGNTAISIVVYDAKGTMLGKPISGRFRYIRNWQASNDEIKIISGACVQLE